VPLCTQWRNAWSHIPSWYVQVSDIYDQLHLFAGHWQHAWEWHICIGFGFAPKTVWEESNVFDFRIKGFQIGKDASTYFIRSPLVMCFIPQKAKTILLFISRAFVYCEVWWAINDLVGCGKVTGDYWLTTVLQLTTEQHVSSQLYADGSVSGAIVIYGLIMNCAFLPINSSKVILCDSVGMVTSVTT